MSGWQPQQNEPGQQGQGDPWGPGGGYTPQDRQQLPEPYRDPRAAQPQYQPQYQPAPRQAPRGLTSAGAFWYVLQCISFGAGYFAKVPAKKALQDFGMVQMTAAEKFWYVLMCIGFGAGYFAKLPIAKALSEMQYRQ